MSVNTILLKYHPLFLSFLFYSNAITNFKSSKLKVMYHNVPKIYCMRDETLKYP